MDWKTLLGSAYVEGMTDEECQVKFSEIYMPRSDYEKDLKEKKSLIDSYSAQIAENKRKERERMSETEKAEADRQAQWEALQNQNKQLQRELQVNKLKSSYMKRGFDEEFALETANAMYDNDTATVLSNEQIFADKRETQLKSAWEKEYAVNPPAGNGSAKVDYSKQIAEAQESGNLAMVASLTRQQYEANSGK